MAPIYPVHKHDLETGAYLDANGKATTDPGEYIYDYEELACRIMDVMR